MNRPSFFSTSDPPDNFGIRWFHDFHTSVGHLHPVPVQVGPGPGGAATYVDLVGGVDARAAVEPVHKQEVGVLVGSVVVYFNIFSNK